MPSGSLGQSGTEADTACLLADACLAWRSMNGRPDQSDESSIEGDPQFRAAGVRGRRLDVVLMLVSALVLIGSALLAARGVYAWEVAIFQAVNGLPNSIRPFLWVLNQYGTALTIPVATAIALAFRRWTLAVSLAVSGVAVYVLAKVIKEYVGRGRPSALLENVVARESFSPDSLGYPSGHAAVAWAITIVVLAHLGRPWQIAAIALAIIVPTVRMYVAAHMPLDLIGGAALGVLVASAMNLLFRPNPAAENAHGPGV
jgi:membrane-associated phospholipid phosphatase